MDVVRGVTFDLDDTLYLEKDYVLSGFRFIADTAGDDFAAPEAIFEFLVKAFNDGVRGNSFNHLSLKFPSLSMKWRVEDLVELYRTHPPVIDLFDGAMEMLGQLKEAGVRLAMITDGPQSSQSSKIATLSIQRYFQQVVLTDVWGVEFRKPHAKAFQQVMAGSDIEPAQWVYIGDNPEKDFYAPRALGWHTVRLRVQGQLRFGLEAQSPEFAAEREFWSFADLVCWLRRACGLKLEHCGGSPK